MGATFVTGSSQRLLNTPAPVTVPPFSVGMWVQPATGAGTLWSIADNATATNVWLINQTAGTAFGFLAAAGGAGVTATCTITVTTGQWYYLVARAASSTNRLMSVLGPDGTVAVGTNTTSTVPAGVDASSLGGSATSSSAFWSGIIGEYWITNTDIQPDGLQLVGSTLNQLARYGPFSIPSIRSNIVDYRSLRYALTSDRDSEPDYFKGNLGPQVWTNSASPSTLGAHPPFLAPEYKRPGDFVRPGIV